MAVSKEFIIKLDKEAYLFYYEIAKLLNRPIEDILSDTLCRHADLMCRKINECTETAKVEA